MKRFKFLIYLFLIVFLLVSLNKFYFCSACDNETKNRSSCFIRRLNENLKKFTIKVWIYKKYIEAKSHKASFDFNALMDLGEEVLNKPLRQRFNRNIYSSALLGPKLIIEMTDEEIIEAIEYELNNWYFHMDYKLNPPKYWHIIIDARPYLNDINDMSCIVFYLLNCLYCDTNPCSICGDGCRYWSLKNEAIKRSLKILP